MTVLLKDYRNRLETLCRGFPGDIEFNADLSRKNTIRVGGTCFAWYEPGNLESLVSLLRFVEQKNIRWKVIGCGSNVLYPEEWSGTVYISLEDKFFKKLRIEGDMVYAGAGSRLSAVIGETTRAGLSGLEALVGIPGTVGGAVNTNASYRKSVGDMLVKILFLDCRGKLKWLQNEDIRFEYRKTVLPAAGIIMEAVFRLRKKDPGTIKKELRNNFMSKMSAQPLIEKTLGCVFKNSGETEFSSGELIDKAGLKGYTSGGAVISDKHANFIVNAGGATVRDIKELMNVVFLKLKERFGVCLEPEIEIL